MPQTHYHAALLANFARAIPHARECGIRIDSLDATGAVASLPYRRDWLGDVDRGRIHTGVIATLVDTVMGLAALAATGEFQPIATLDLRMDYLRPALPDRVLYSRAGCYRLTRSIAFVRASAWQEREDEPVAVGQAAFMRSTRKPAGPA